MTNTRWNISIGLTLLVQACVLYYAFHYGTLSGLLQHDDGGIVLRGLQNLDRLAKSTSLLAAAHLSHTLDIHAPLSDVQVMLGLLVSGGATWGPYLFNALWLALVLEALLRTFAPSRRTLAVALILFVIVQPVTINALEDVKSDWEGGLLMAGALYVLTEAARQARSDLKLWGAVLLGLSILSKLTAFYLPFVAIMILMLFEWHSVALQPAPGTTGSQPGAAARFTSLGALLRAVDKRSFALRLLIAAGPFIFFFLFKIRTLLTYIVMAVGQEWADGLSLAGRVRLYGPYGTDSVFQWGNLHIFCLVSVIAALFVAVPRGDRGYLRVMGLHLIIAVVLLMPLILTNSNHSYEATLLGVIMSATMVSMRVVAGSTLRWASPAVLVGTILIALPAALPVRASAYYSSFPTTSSELRQLASTYARIEEVMAMHAHRDAPHIVVFYDHLFATHPNLGILYFQKTGTLASVDRVDDLADMSAAGPLAQADFLLTIAPTPGQPGTVMPGLYPQWPVSKDPARADDIARASGQFDLLGTFAVRGGEIHLYGNRQPE